MKQKLIDLHNRWFLEWEEFQKDRDALPMNHAHRQIYEGMCNCQTAWLRELQNLIESL